MSVVWKWFGMVLEVSTAFGGHGRCVIGLSSHVANVSVWRELVYTVHRSPNYCDTYVWGRNIALRGHMRTISYQIIEKRLFYQIIMISLTIA